jgi:hypothetical protein
MSAVGRSQTTVHVRFGSKADKGAHVCRCPLGAISDRTQRSKIRSLDHLVGSCQQRGRYLEAERLGCLEIDDKFELDWRFHR